MHKTHTWFTAGSSSSPGTPPLRCSSSSQPCSMSTSHPESVSGTCKKKYHQTRNKLLTDPFKTNVCLIRCRDFGQKEPKGGSRRFNDFFLNKTNWMFSEKCFKVIYYINIYYPFLKFQQFYSEPNWPFAEYIFFLLGLTCSQLNRFGLFCLI